jgi:hypothetical protein
MWSPPLRPREPTMWLCPWPKLEGKISDELSMSDSAVNRHISKLVRRGYAGVSGEENGVLYRLSSCYRSPIHQELLGIVQSVWTEESSRSWPTPK